MHGAGISARLAGGGGPLQVVRAGADMGCCGGKGTLSEGGGTKWSIYPGPSKWHGCKKGCGIWRQDGGTGEEAHIYSALRSQGHSSWDHSMLKIGVRLGKALSGPRDLPRAVGPARHPAVLTPAGKRTASRGQPCQRCPASWPCQQHQLAFSRLTACLNKCLTAVWGAPELWWRWALRQLEQGSGLR